MFEAVRPIAVSARKPRAEFCDYDPRYAKVAHLVKRVAEAAIPNLLIEHVGGTAIPGCAGKPIVDLLALYERGGLEDAKALIRALGFVSQGSEFRKPWPEDRPMRLGYVRYEGTPFLVYIHVVAKDSYEATRFRIFRDRLQKDQRLRSRYVEVKRSIIDRGVTDTDDYRLLKRGIIHEILGEEYSAKHVSSSGAGPDLS